MGKIKFDTPAKDWNEALPIGNGRIGAMIFGNENRERVQLNGDSIWYGGPQNRCNDDAYTTLPAIRKLILEDENMEEAQRLMTYALSGTPQGQRPYQTAGDLWIDWGYPSVTEYSRQLNLDEGIVQAQYKIGENLLEKEYLASYPAQVIGIRFKASIPGSLKFTVMMTRERFYDGTGKLDDNSIQMWGNQGENGVRFSVGVKATTKGGKVTVVGEHLIVEGADEAVLYVAIETSFYEKGDLKKALLKRLNYAENKTFESLKQDHQKDYKELYDRVKISLGEKDKKDKKLQYVEDYFQFGRYLCISASRPGSLPSNLQGIWNASMTPPWDSKYTININLEMNYWPVESCNLSECHEPLFELLKRMHKSGKEIARKMYGCRGFVAHHNTDIWADCAPQDIYIPASYWVMGGAWLCTNIWTHYIYTKDDKFLAKMYPILQDAVLFFHDYLVEEKGELVTCPSVSPENTYILPSGMKGCVCAGASMDNQILRDLMQGYLKASEQLNINNEEVEKTKEIIKRIPRDKIGKHGQIMEWREDYDEVEPGHRHISQLYALHPSQQITTDGTPELAKAARKTLERRLQYGGGHTGWSCAWIINLYARLFDGEKAWENIQKMFEKSTFPNRMSNHPAGDGFVFQIDGNYGATAAISEMLLQSNEERTILLPAIPAEWSEGSIMGLSMCGGASIDMKWLDGKVESCTIHAKNSIETQMLWNGKKKYVQIQKGEDYILL